ncbi:MAG: SpoIIE family protein phosphatase [Gammaproteobacteria bacterium]
MGAGHLPALASRRRSQSARQRGTDAGIPLGILPDHRWENAVTPFAPGDLLVTYTDGVVEARDRDRGRCWRRSGRSFFEHH